MHDAVPLKVWSRCGAAAVVAASNVLAEGGGVSGSLYASDVPDLTGQRFAIFDWYAKRCHLVARDEPTELELAEDDAALYVLVPADDEFAVIGIVDKYVTPATIRDQARLPGRCVVTLRVGGQLGYTSPHPHTVLVNGAAVEPRREDGYFTVPCPGDGALVELIRS